MRFIPGPELLDSPVGRELPGWNPDAMAVRTDAPPTTCDVAILGGGVAGVTLAVQLWHAGLLDGTVLLERGPTLVGQFFDRLHGLRQRVLRRPLRAPRRGRGASRL